MQHAAGLVGTATKCCAAPLVVCRKYVSSAFDVQKKAVAVDGSFLGYAASNRPDKTLLIFTCFSGVTGLDSTWDSATLMSGNYSARSSAVASLLLDRITQAHALPQRFHDRSKGTASDFLIHRIMYLNFPKLGHVVRISV